MTSLVDLTWVSHPCICIDAFIFTGTISSFDINKTQHEDLDLPWFELHTISAATNNFSEKNKLGEGGFGPVYKVSLSLSHLPASVHFLYQSKKKKKRDIHFFF